MLGSKKEKKKNGWEKLRGLNNKFRSARRRMGDRSAQFSDHHTRATACGAAHFFLSQTSAFCISVFTNAVLNQLYLRAVLF